MTAMDASMIDFMPAKKPTMRRTSLNTREVLLPSTGELTYAHRRKMRGCADAGTANAPADSDAATSNAPACADEREANMPTDAATQCMQRSLHRYVLYVFHIP